MERPLTLIGALVAATIAVAVPGGHYLWAVDSERAIIRTEAQINARLLSVIVNSNPELWQFEQLKIEALLANRNLDGVPEERQLVGLKGEVIAESLDPLMRPSVAEGADVHDASRKVATLLVRRSLVPAIVSTAGVAAASLVLAMLVFLSIRILPVRSLRKARERELRMASALDLAAAKEAEAQRQSEADRSRQQAILRALIDALPDLIWYKDVQARYMGCNAAFEDALGVRLAQLGGKTDDFLYEPARAALIRERDLQLLQTLETQHFEEWVTFRDGRRFMEITKKPFWDSQGNLVGLVGVGRDLTLRKQSEDDIRRAKELAEEATRMKSDFLANMSHEIRTPMNAILGLSHLLRRTQLTERQADFVQKLEGSGRHLLGVINDILDFSKVEAGKLDLDRTEFELQVVFDTVTMLVADKSAAKGLELVFRLSPELPRTALGDRLRLGQVLTNLVNNAVKFTDRGEIVVSADLAARTGNGFRVRFSVRDTGIGMSQAQMGKLFQSFHQVDSSITRNYGGTGLGLAISKRFVELMGGEIGVTSEPGHGSTFWFEVPLEPGADSPRAPQADLRGRRALVVDDNDVARTVILGMLHDLGLEAEGCSSGFGALQAIRRAVAEKRPYELVYLDWKMPEMDGVETARRIHALGLSKVPLMVMVTAYDRADMLRESAGMRAVEVLSKPVSSTMLAHATVAALSCEPVAGGAPEPVPDLRSRLAPILGARILLVEDNDINQIVAAEILIDAGLVVDIAENGAQAVARVQADHYDLVLMDMQMPVLNGIDATIAIRKLGGLGGLPIIAMTANAMEPDRIRCLEAGMNDYISKPIDPEQLASVLLQWAGRARRPQKTVAG